MEEAKSNLLYLDTHKLGAYNNARDVAYNVLKETDWDVGLYVSPGWTHLDSWHTVVSRDFPGRISVHDEKPSDAKGICYFTCGVRYDASFKEEDDHLSISLNGETVKFNTVRASSDQRVGELRSKYQNGSQKPIMVLGSVYAHDLDFIQYHLKDMVDRYNLLLSPRFIDTKTLDSIAERLDQVGLSPVLRGEGDDFHDSSCLIADKQGDLKELYGIGTVNVVGGSFSPEKRVGGHNPLESIIYGIPTVMGPNVGNLPITDNFFRSTPFLHVAESNSYLEIEDAFKKAELAVDNVDLKVLNETLVRARQTCDSVIDKIVREIRAYE